MDIIGLSPWKSALFGIFLAAFPACAAKVVTSTGTPSQIEQHSQAAGDVIRIAEYGDSLYFLTRGPGFSDGTLQVMDRTTGTTEVLANHLTDPHWVLPLQSGVYWSDKTRVARWNGTENEILATGGDIRAAALQDLSVVYADWKTGEVRSILPGLRAPGVLAIDQSRVTAIARGPGGAYWVNGADTADERGIYTVQIQQGMNTAVRLTNEVGGLGSRQLDVRQDRMYWLRGDMLYSGSPSGSDVRAMYTASSFAIGEYGVFFTASTAGSHGGAVGFISHAQGDACYFIHPLHEFVKPPGYGRPRSVAIGKARLYWAQGSDIYSADRFACLPRS